MDTRDAGALGGKSRSKKKLKAAARNLALARPVSTEERRINGQRGAEKRARLAALAAALLPHLKARELAALAKGDLSPFEGAKLRRAAAIPEDLKDRRLLARAIQRLIAQLE